MLHGYTGFVLRYQKRENVMAAPVHVPPPNANAATSTLYHASPPLGLVAIIFTTMSRLRFFGVNASGACIALFAGVMAPINLATSACIVWVMASSAVAQNSVVCRHFIIFTSRSEESVSQCRLRFSWQPCAFRLRS